MRVANFFNSLFSWVLATLLVCICVVVFYYYHRGDEELRRYIETAIAEKCPTHAVAIGSASLIHGEGIRLRNVSFSQNGSSQLERNREELAFCEELMLHCNPSIPELLDGNVLVQRVLLRGLSLRAIRTQNGTWNLSQLIPPAPQNDIPFPTIVVENANVLVIDNASQQPTQFALGNVNATISPSSSSDRKIDVNVALNSKHFKQANLSATVDLDHVGSWIASGQVDDLNCNGAIRTALALQSAQVPPLVDGLGALAQVQFSLAKGVSESQPRFHVEAQISNGKYDAPRFLTQPITDITIPSLRCISDGQHREWAIQNATASYGTAKIEMSAAGPSFSPDSDVLADFTTNRLDITRELIGILPAKLQDIWNKYQPLGIVDIQAKCVRQNGEWLTNANAICRDLSLEFQRFKYPLTRCQGTVSFQQNVEFKADIWGAPDRTWKTNPIHVTANIQHPGKQFTGEISVGMEPRGWLPIDARVHNAIPPGVRKVLTDMAARGELNFQTLLQRSSPDQMRFSKETLIQVRNGGMKHANFPYPLQNVSGQIHLKDDVYRFLDFRGQNDSCLVTCSGHWKSPTESEPSQLALEFVAKDIPCDTELRQALPTGPKQVWRGLRPTGTIDHAVINLNHRGGMVKPEIGIVVTQLGRDNDPDRRSIEIQPTWFPLAMDRVTGVFEFMPDGSFAMKNIQAEHGSRQRTVKLRTEGGGIFRDNGTWDIQLTRMIADRIETTPEFIAALPKNLSDALRTLKFQGTLFVNANDVRFSGTSDPNVPIEATWSSTINVDNGSFVLAQHPVKNLYGEVTVSGRRQQGDWTNGGDARFDSLICKGIQVTKLSSPWYMNRSQLLIGNANNNRGAFASADVFGGKARATGQVNFTKDVDFGFNLALSDFDAGQLSRDMSLPSKITGRGDARLILEGNAQGTHSLRGEGGIRLRDANLAKLPAIITLVNTMKLRKSRPDVFSSSNIDFRVNGTTAYLDHFDLHGESLTMKGRGWIALDRRVDLQFYSLLGGERNYWKFVRPLAGQTSQNLLQILVSGTVDNLDFSRKVLPGWNDLFPEPVVATEPRNVIRLR